MEARAVAKLGKNGPAKSERRRYGGRRKGFLPDLDDHNLFFFLGKGALEKSHFPISSRVTQIQDIFG